MKAALIEEKHKVVLKDVDEPALAAGKVRIAVDRSGICGSDLHWYNGRWSPPAFAPGHEFVGRIVETGEGVENVKVGDRVVVQAFAHCGKCEKCAAGRYNLCEAMIWPGGRYHGGLAERACTCATAAIPVSDQLSDQQAAMVEPAAVSYRAATRFGREAYERAIVIGGGTIGLLCVNALKALGAKRIVAVTKYDQQSDLAGRLGATDIVQLGKAEPRQTIKEILPKGGDLVVDSVTVGNSVSLAIELAEKGGRVVLVGGITKPLLTMFGPLVNRELMMTGSNCYAISDGKHDFEWVSDLIVSGALDVDALVTHTFPLAQIGEAFKVASDKTTGAVKVQIEM